MRKVVTRHLGYSFVFIGASPLVQGVTQAALGSSIFHGNGFTKAVALLLASAQQLA